MPAEGRVFPSLPNMPTKSSQLLAGDRGLVRTAGQVAAGRLLHVRRTADTSARWEAWFLVSQSSGDQSRQVEKLFAGGRPSLLCISQQSRTREEKTYLRLRAPKIVYRPHSSLHQVDRSTMARPRLSPLHWLLRRTCLIRHDIATTA